MKNQLKPLLTNTKVEK